MKKLIKISIVLATVISGANATLPIHPLGNSFKSIDNGGLKSAIDAYKDGIGVEIVDNPGVATDNSAMNTLVYKYGEAAKVANITIVDQVLYGTGTAADKVIAGRLTIDGAGCNDNNAGTTGETWLNGVCQGGIIVSANGDACNDNNLQTIHDIYTNGVCTGILVNYFVSSTGSNSNSGTYNFPFVDFTNIPENSIVAIKNGTYSDMYTVDGYHSANLIFKGIGLKNNITIYGESRSGVNILITNTASRDETIIPSSVSTQSNIKLINMTINHNLPSGTNYEVSLSRAIFNTEFNNILFNISGNYSLNYNNSGGTVSYNNCIFNGGSRLSNYSGSNIISSTIKYPLF